MIAGRLPGRTDNEIKNYWNTHIRRKLLNRGIDPATHRPLNEAASSATVVTVATASNISFGKQEQETTSSSNGSVVKGSILERCPDLNLELTISPPRQQHQQQQPQKNLCFVCSLGLPKSKDCSCNVANAVTANNTAPPASASAYDFLGLKTNGVWDCTTLEMK